MQPDPEFRDSVREKEFLNLPVSENSSENFPSDDRVAPAGDAGQARGGGGGGGEGGADGHWPEHVRVRMGGQPSFLHAS